MPFGLHAFDLVIVCVLALMVFGPKRLPEMGSAVGKTFQAFKQSMSEITDSIKHETTTPEHQIAAPVVTPTTTQPTVVSTTVAEPIIHQ